MDTKGIVEEILIKATNGEYPRDAIDSLITECHGDPGSVVVYLDYALERQQTKKTHWARFSPESIVHVYGCLARCITRPCNEVNDVAKGLSYEPMYASEYVPARRWVLFCLGDYGLVHHVPYLESAHRFLFDVPYMHGYDDIIGASATAVRKLQTEQRVVTDAIEKCRQRSAEAARG